MLLPEMRLDGGKRLTQRDVAVCIEEIVAGYLKGTWNITIPDTMASVVKTVEIDRMMATEGKLEIDERKKKEMKADNC